MDSDCGVRRMPGAVVVQCTLIQHHKISYVGYAGVLPLPAVLGENIQHKNVKQAFHVMPTLVRSCMPCWNFLTVVEDDFISVGLVV